MSNLVFWWYFLKEKVETAVLFNTVLLIYSSVPAQTDNTKDAVHAEIVINLYRSMC